MTRWFRFDASAVRHPKVAKLSDKNFRWWIRLLAVAAENRGSLPPIEDLKHVLNARLDHLLTALDALVQSGLMDAFEGRYSPHNWEKYQMKSDVSTDRVREWRRKRNVSETEHDTRRYETIHKIESHLDRSPILKERLLPQQLTKSSDLVRSGFTQFWKAWDHKVGKPAAEKAFAKAFAKHGLQPILDGLARYIASKPPDRPWLNPSTFLNQERFLDEPAAEPTRTGPQDGLTQVLNELRERSNGNGNHQDFRDITPRAPEHGGCNVAVRDTPDPETTRTGRSVVDLFPARSGGGGFSEASSAAWKTS